MSLSRLIFSLCISLAAFVPHSHAQRVADVFLTDSATTVGISIEMPKGYFSGLCVAEKREDKIVGSVVNEFGISAFSFQYDIKRERVELTDVITFLNRWYIRRTVKSDLKYLFRNIDKEQPAPDRNRVLHISADSIVLRNTRHNISYQFIKLPDNEIIE